MSLLTRTILVCNAAQLPAARIMLAYAEFLGFDDVGEVDNLTPTSQEVTQTVAGVTTTYKVIELRVPAATATALESLFDPRPAERATWNDRIDAQRLKVATLRAIRAKSPATRTAEEKAMLREAVRDLPGNLPTVAAFRQAARACRYWILNDGDERSVEQWFKAKNRADDGWAWVVMPVIPNP